MRYLHFHDFVYKNGICHQSLALLKKYNMFFILFRYKHELVKNKKNISLNTRCRHLQNERPCFTF